MKNQQKLKRQDKLLNCERKLDGTVEITRKSPFYHKISYPVLTIQNKFTGSFKWIISEIMLKDSQHFDMITKAIKANTKIRNKPNDERIHQETAELIQSNEKIVV